MMRISLLKPSENVGCEFYQALAVLREVKRPLLQTPRFR